MVSGIDLFSNILFQTFVYFTVLTYYISNLDSVKVAQSQILWLECHWLKHYLTLELFSADLPYDYPCMF